ncbi:hypothetical protein NDU88_007546 [Pleurodeles waltl]|uniref:Uncharacterized protein n=1 Tax=Pleurodeles waltl TaxID=8319 RepID=A0AAV7P2G9_PLEWA|nr:hypothetical protein NDU88_007546 [Pleurodeles waltl]
MILSVLIPFIQQMFLFKAKSIVQSDDNGGEPELVLRFLQEVEEQAEEVLADKQQIVDLDIKRNQNREALRDLQRELGSSEHV